MSYTLPAVMTALLCFAATFSHAGQQSKKTKVIRVNPCESDFALKVVVTPAEGTDNWPVGFALDFKRGAKRGIASRVQSEQWTDFTEASCQRWQKRNWQLLDMILTESRRLERRKMVCRNIASISYRLGSSPWKMANVCLGGIKEDSVAYIFREFFENGDGLVR